MAVLYAGASHRRRNRCRLCGQEPPREDGYSSADTEKRRKISMFRLSFYLCDCIILALQMSASDAGSILYGIRFDRCLHPGVLDKGSDAGRGQNAESKSSAREHDAINRLLAEKIDCGTSLLHMETGFLHREQNMVLAVISSRDLP